MIKLKNILGVLTIFLLLLGGCTTLNESTSDTIEIPNLDLTLTPAKGWLVDDTVEISDPAKGGVLIRLSPNPEISGAPKFQVYLDPLRVKSPTLKTLADEQWTRFEAMKNKPGVTVETMEKNKIQLLDQDAMLLTQTYTLGSGPAQISVNEQTWLLQHNNRGVAFVVSGRTELVTPWNEAIQEMLASVATQKQGSVP